MGVKNWLKSLWKDKPTRAAPTPPAEVKIVFPTPVDLPSLDAVMSAKDIKKQIQHLDELITASEMEIVKLSEDLDRVLLSEKTIEIKIGNLDETQQWTGQSLLLNLKRSRTHSEGLKQRILIYSQNIDLYHDLLHKIQDKQAMKLGGIDETKIENIWIDYKEELEQYKNKLMTGQSANDSLRVTTPETEQKLETLKKEVVEKQTRPKIEDVVGKEPIRDADGLHFLSAERTEPALE